MAEGTPSRPTEVKVALGLMIGGLLVSGARTLFWPPAMPSQPYSPTAFTLTLVVGLVLGFAFNGGLAVAIAFRQRWAFFVYLVLVVISVPIALLGLAQQGGHAGSVAAYLVLLAAEIATIALLLSRPARAWFALPRANHGIPAQWYPDPAGRHEHRYWDGIAWTSYVADRGEQSVEPLPGASPASTA